MSNLILVKFLLYLSMYLMANFTPKSVESSKTIKPSIFKSFSMATGLNYMGKFMDWSTSSTWDFFINRCSTIISPRRLCSFPTISSTIWISIAPITCPEVTNPFSNAVIPKRFSNCSAAILLPQISVVVLPKSPLNMWCHFIIIHILENVYCKFTLSNSISYEIAKLLKTKSKKYLNPCKYRPSFILLFCF